MSNRTLFDDQASRRPDARQGQKIVYDGDTIQSDPSPDEDKKPSQHVVSSVLETLEEEGERDTLRARYARLLWAAATNRLTVGEGQGKKALKAVTDKEAASLLSCEKTTVNARRNELMGGMEEYEVCPVVVEAGKRKSYVRPTKHENTTYKLNPLLIDAMD